MPLSSRPSRRRVRAAVPALVVPLLLAGLTACGGSDDSGDTAASSPSPATSSETTSPSSGASPLKGTAVGTNDFTALVKRSLDKATTAKVALKLVGGDRTITGTGQVDYTQKDPSLAMKLPGFGNADLRVIGRTVYIKVPSAGMGNTFFTGDLDDPAVSQQLGSLSGFDPASSLEAMTQSIDSVVKVGGEKIDGDQVTHYRFRSVSDANGTTQSTTVDAWFDRQELLRKTQTTLGDGTQVTLTLSDWGSPVDIEAPPASQVKKLPTATASPS